MVLVPHKTTVHIPEMDYLGMITKVEYIEKGRYGETLNIIGTVKQEPYQGIEVAGYFPFRITAKNKTGKLVKAILDPEAAKRDVDTDEILKILCWLEIRNHTTEEGVTISKLVGAKKYEPGTPKD